MDNRTTHRAGSSYQPSRSILKPSRSSHSHPNTRQISRSPPSHPDRAVQIADPPTQAQTHTQAIRNIATGSIPEITFPAVHNVEQLEQLERLEQLVFEFSKQIQARRRQLESNNEAPTQRLPPPLPPPPASAGRPTYSPDDYPEFRDTLMGPWQAGPYYGPILKPRDVMRLGPLRINPLISSPSQVHWDVTQSPAKAFVIQDGRIILFDEFCHQPATCPRITEVKVISRLMPWEWVLSSWSKETGVTIGDVFHSLSISLGVRMGERDMNKLTDESRMTAIRTHQARCPEGGKGPQIYDILAGDTLFGGWTYEHERDRDNAREINILISYLPYPSRPG